MNTIIKALILAPFFFSLAHGMQQGIYTDAKAPSDALLLGIKRLNAQSSDDDINAIVYQIHKEGYTVASCISSLCAQKINKAKCALNTQMGLSEDIWQRPAHLFAKQNNFYRDANPGTITVHPAQSHVINGQYQSVMRKICRIHAELTPMLSLSVHITGAFSQTVLMRDYRWKMNWKDNEFEFVPQDVELLFAKNINKLDDAQQEALIYREFLKIVYGHSIIPQFFQSYSYGYFGINNIWQIDSYKQLHRAIQAEADCMTCLYNPYGALGLMRTFNYACNDEPMSEELFLEERMNDCLPRPHKRYKWACVIYRLCLSEKTASYLSYGIKNLTIK